MDAADRCPRCSHERAIESLLIAYCTALDAGDFDAVADLFRAATFTSTRSDRVRRGRDEIRGIYDGVMVYDDGTPRTRHVLANLEIAVDPDGQTASSRCTFTVLQAVTPGRIDVVLAGEYHDEFAYTAGRWAFRSRLVEPALIGDLRRHTPGRSA
jgi:3-phenylpropionate/cinnamic acid dioxygenase small subunit